MLLDFLDIFCVGSFAVNALKLVGCQEWNKPLYNATAIPCKPVRHHGLTSCKSEKWLLIM